MGSGGFGLFHCSGKALLWLKRPLRLNFEVPSDSKSDLVVPTERQGSLHQEMEAVVMVGEDEVAES